MPFYVALFWAIVLFLDKKNRNVPKQFLGFFFLLTAINYFVHVLYFNRQYGLYAFFDSVWIMTSLLGYPLYYYYIRLLTVDVKLNWRYVWIVVPAIALALFSAVLYAIMSPSEVDLFVRGILYKDADYVRDFYSLPIRLHQLKLLLFKVVFLVQVAFSLSFGICLIVKYDAKLKDFYSNSSGKSLAPVKWLLVAFVFASGVSLLSNFIGKTFFIAYDYLLVIPSLLHTLFLFAIGYVGFRQDFTIADFCRDMALSDQLKEGKEEKEPLLPLNYESQKEQLISFMKEELAFRNPDLCITDLAIQLNTNRTYVSRLINEGFQTNFADLVNKYRVQYAEQLLLSEKASLLSIKEIGEQSGFPSGSSFYRVFKKETGVSPGKFGNKKEPTPLFVRKNKI